MSRQLGRSHWDADTVLHLELREGSSKDSSKDELLASAKAPLRAVGESTLELGNELSGKLLHPCTFMLWRVPFSHQRPKHLFLVHHAETSYYGLDDWSINGMTAGFASRGRQHSPGAAAPAAAPATARPDASIRERLGAMVDRGGQVLEKLRKTDHPISRQGWQQAKALQLALKQAQQRLAFRGERMEKGVPDVDEIDAEVSAEALEDAEVAETGSVLQLLLRSQALWTSPQCRAVQTAMIALQPLTCDGALPVEVRGLAREQRELTNPASVGNCAGDALRTRCLDKLREMRVEDEAGLRALDNLQLNIAEVERAWWSSLPETDKEYQQRAQELLTQVQFSPHDSIVLVAHTGLFVELAARHAAEDVREQQHGTLRALAAGQVEPCAVAWFSLDFNQAGSRPVTDVALLNDDLNAYFERRASWAERRASRDGAPSPPAALAAERQVTSSV